MFTKRGSKGRKLAKGAIVGDESYLFETEPPPFDPSTQRLFLLRGPNVTNPRYRVLTVNLETGTQTESTSALPPAFSYLYGLVFDPVSGSR
jgi:hypothetical protein